MPSRAWEQSSVQAGDVSGMAAMNMAVNGFNNVSSELGSAVIPLTSGKYLTDQHVISYANTAGSSFNAQQVANPFPSLPGIPNGLKITCSAAATPAAGDNIQLYQPIEGNRAAKLAWGTGLGVPLTLGWVIRPSYAMIAYVGVANGVANNRVRFTRFVCPANVDTFIPARFDPDTQGTWTKDYTAGLVPYLILQSGSNLFGTPDTWLGSSIFRAGSDITNLCAVAGQSVIVSGLVLLPGIVPISREVLPLLARHVPAEEDLCMRYWERLYNTWTGLQYQNFEYKKRKRDLAALTVSTPNGGVALSYSTDCYRVSTVPSSPVDTFVYANSRM